MGIRTTVTLDEDVLNRVKAESKATGSSFRETLNELVREGLASKHDLKQRKREFRIDPIHTGARRDLNYDSTEALLEALEGPYHR
jgi:metal-responsive CopG/Arc/MetJ family transcriptional regulator